MIHAGQCSNAIGEAGDTVGNIVDDAANGVSDITNDLVATVMILQVTTILHCHHRSRPEISYTSSMIVPSR